ncbi:MAG: MATE family efflux transporter [Candidatus Omnitrophica bacterium]|nr:MATE family efflux transporter [Candidatus Omnitrophota bacterium]
MKKLNKHTHRRGGLREMLSIALPMVVSNACDTVMVFTDRLFLSRLSPELMNASMAGGLTSFMLESFFLGLAGYTTALAAQYLGAGKKRLCPVVVTQAIIFSCIAYPLILLARPLAYRLFEFMGVGGEQIGPQKVYFNILIYGVIISLARTCLSGFFSGIGRTRIVMIASCTAMLVNVGLNYLLIYGKMGFSPLGIRGAAYGTLLGGLSGLVILALAYFRKSMRREFRIKESLRFDFVIAKNLWKFGSSAGLEMFLNLLAFSAIVLIFHSHNPATATAATIVFNWDMVSFVPLIGIEIGVTSLVGRCMGAGDPKTAHASVMSGLKLGLVYSAVILILFAGFPGNLVGVFRPDSVHEGVFISAMPIAVFMVRLASLYVLVEAVLIVFIGALRGAGDTFWAMKTSVALHWLMAVVLWFMLKKWGTSPEAAWSTMVFIFLLFSGLVFLRYNSGKWKDIKIVHPEPAEAITVDVFHEHTDV